MGSKRADVPPTMAPAALDATRVASVGAAGCAAVLVSATGEPLWAAVAASWTAVVVAAANRLHSLRAVGRGAMLGALALAPVTGVVAWIAARTAASPLVLTVSQYIFAATLVGAVLGATVAGPLAALAKWSALRRSFDAPEHALFLASGWLTACAMLTGFGAPESRTAALSALGGAFVANAAVIVAARRHRKWLSDVRQGRNPHWSIAVRGLHEHTGLPPLLMPRDPVTLDGVLSRHDGHGEGPFRAAPREQPVALVHLHPDAGQDWAGLRLQIASALMLAQAIAATFLAVG